MLDEPSPKTTPVDTELKSKGLEILVSTVSTGVVLGLGSSNIGFSIHSTILYYSHKSGLKL